MIITLASSASARFSATMLPECCQGPALQHLMIPRVAAWSMYPTLCKGDRLELASLESVVGLDIGDLVVFRSPSGLVCHRLVDRRNDLLFTKGDASPGPPEQVLIHDVLGIVAAVARGSTRVITADLAALPPPLPWRRLLDRLNMTLCERSGWFSRKVIRHLLNVPCLGELIANWIARGATIERASARPVLLFRTVARICPEESQSGQPSQLVWPVILGIRLGPVHLGLFYPESSRLEVRTVLAGTSVESALHRTLLFNWPPADGRAGPYDSP